MSPITLGVVIMSVGVQPSVSVVERFFHALRTHDAEEAMSLLDDSFVLRNAAGTFEARRDDLHDLLAWDAMMKERFAIASLRTDDDFVIAVLTTTNDFLELLGMTPVRLEARFRVKEEVLVEETLTELVPSRPSLDEALQPVVFWASKRHPELLARAYPDSRLVFSGEKARVWREILNKWFRREELSSARRQIVGAYARQGEAVRQKDTAAFMGLRTEDFTLISDGKLYQREEVESSFREGLERLFVVRAITYTVQEIAVDGKVATALVAQDFARAEKVKEGKTVERWTREIHRDRWISTSAGWRLERTKRLSSHRYR